MILISGSYAHAPETVLLLEMVFYVNFAIVWDLSR